MSRSSQQHHRHGVKKNLVEGIGGVLVGAALVLLVRGMVRRRAAQRVAPAQREDMIAATSGEPA